MILHLNSASQIFGTYQKNHYLCNRKKKRKMATILLNVPDESLLAQLKKACQMLKGVASVKVLKSSEENDITETDGYKEAMDDVKHGRVTHYDSVDQLFEELGIAVK